MSFEGPRATGAPEIRRIAELQHACIHRHQLLAAGLGPTGIARRIRAGALQRMHRSVYVLHDLRRSRYTPLMAAALHFRGDALIAGRSAAFAWGFWEAQPSRVEVLLVGRHARAQPGVAIRRTAGLDPRDVRHRHGIPLTSPARTLLDLASVLDPYELEGALALASRRTSLRDSDLRELLASAPGTTAGIVRLRTLIEHDPGAAPRDSRSIYERRLVRMIDDAGLPRPLANVSVAGHMVDLHWPAHRLVVEFDSWAFHGDRRAFETDRRRDQDLMAAGQAVMRITARQVDHGPLALIARLAAAIAARGPDR